MSSDADGRPGGAWWRAPWVGVVAMVVLVASAGVITWVLMRAMQDEPDGIAAPTAPSTMAPPSPQTSEELSAKWAPTLEASTVLQPCDADPYTVRCRIAVFELRDQAVELAADADSVGFAGLAREARTIAGQSGHWGEVCVFSDPGTVTRSDCFGHTSGIFYGGGPQALLAALHKALRDD